MALPVFTIQTFSQNTLQPAGAVFAQRVETISVARNFLGGISGSGASRNTVMEKKMNELNKSLLEELQSQAKAIYPSTVALVDVKIHFSDIGKDDSNILLVGQASATSLIKRNKPVASTLVAPASSAQAPAQAPAAPAQAPAPAAPAPAQAQAPAAFKNNSRMLNNPINSSPVKGGRRKSFINKSRKNRI